MKFSRETTLFLAAVRGSTAAATPKNNIRETVNENEERKRKVIEDFKNDKREDDSAFWTRFLQETASFQDSDIGTDSNIRRKNNAPKAPKAPKTEGKEPKAPSIEGKASKASKAQQTDETAPPTASPTVVLVVPPTPNPTAAPTPNSTAIPTVPPTPLPTALPTVPPTPNPTATPTVPPTPNPTALPTLPPTPNPTAPSTACLTNVLCTDVPTGLTDCGILEINNKCDSDGHCYSFTATGQQKCVLEESIVSASGACDSSCDCLGINSNDYLANQFKYFTTDDYGYVYQKYFENCSSCEGKTCVYSSYIVMDRHYIATVRGGCPSDTVDEYEGGYLYAWNYLKDNHNCYPYLDYNEYGFCYWSCQKY